MKAPPFYPCGHLRDDANTYVMTRRNGKLARRCKTCQIRNARRDYHKRVERDPSFRAVMRERAHRYYQVNREGQAAKQLARYYAKKTAQAGCS